MQPEWNVMTQPNQPPIPLVRELVAALSDAGVGYCHWKSNAAIERAEQGETDLDLLVSRDQARKFVAVLSSCGFFEAVRPRSPAVPGTSDFMGYDMVADRFVHVHAHYQMVLGHDRTKNFRIPIERPYIDSSSVDRLLPTPAPEFEYVVFVIRMVLKYAIADEIFWAAARGRRAGPKPSEMEELEALGSHVDRERVRAVLSDHIPYIGPQVFEMAEAVVRGELGVWRRVRVAKRLRKDLEAQVRKGPLFDSLLRVWRRGVVMIQRRRGVPSRYQLATGGAMIAILGGDGSGKTTVLAELEGWLSELFDVKQVHLGKPKWSWTTYSIRGMLKIMGPIRSPLGSGRDAADDPAELRRLIWLACQARDRYRAFKRVRRYANRGGLVISDRYPHPALRLMEVPQIERLTDGQPRSRFIKRLIRAEERFHSMISQPDVVVVLKLEPEEAGRRKTDEDYEYVVKRAADIWDVDWSRWPVKEVDASQTREAVAADVKAHVWSSLA